MKKSITTVSTVMCMMIVGSCVYAQSATLVPEPQKESGNLAPAEKRAENMYGNAQADQSNVDLPGFPTYVNTGNADHDAEVYTKAKSEWISQNQAIYDAATSGNNTKVNAQPTVADLPGFPVMENTGDVDADYARYKQAKDQWYSENQKLVEEFYRENAKNQPVRQK